MTRHCSARACIRGRPAGICAVILVTLLPAPVSAQKDQFIDAFIEFHSELSGTYGDEGSRAAVALDRMTAALGAWNAANRAAEASLRSAPGYAPSTLALFFLEAGRPAEALSAIESALQLEPTRAGVHMFRGILLDAAGRGADAVRSFETAWQLDPDDPVTAYLLADRTAAGQAPPDLEPQIASLLAASQRVGAAPRRAPFIQVALIDDRAADTPRFLPATYVE
jgi:tetratricopeptide (TPR) repeat protein